ncbi:phosphoribosylanthranilate isomerase [Noviherbaspirillum massiliense]|uniref:phosphoribosylanthranilate isomerase n=1 Tax=Noviherbaspirillum massiliense TaxID=1465823 RepID=UPI000314CE6E|nr:phosphoribosylanthranilate isomerase [Noviherbaspirillum massiliense]
MEHRTRIKICGLTRLEDVHAAVAAGADALGFVFYPKSPRYVSPDRAAELISAMPPFVTAAGLFVNAAPGEVADIVERTGVSLLQFHGDESPEQCHAAANAAKRRFLRAVRMRPDGGGSDLLEYERQCHAASPLFAGLLLDAFVEAYGGAGKVFDWSLIPKELAPRVVLSGGLNAQNAAEAVSRVRPYAVDVSSGVEFEKGIKEHAKIRAFIGAVHQADAALSE